MNAITKSSMARLLGTASLAMVLGATSAMADIRFWTTEYQPERLEKQQEMADAFEEETGIAVEVIPITAEAGLQSRITAAFAAGDMPDVVYHPQQFALPWVEAGILDAEAATEVVEALGSDTFAPAGLSLVSTEDGYAAVPVDGWTQMIVYRRDLFEEKGLAPSSFKLMNTSPSRGQQTGLINGPGSLCLAERDGLVVSAASPTIGQIQANAL